MLECQNVGAAAAGPDAARTPLEFRTDTAGIPLGYLPATSELQVDVEFGPPGARPTRESAGPLFHWIIPATSDQMWRSGAAPPHLV